MDGRFGWNCDTPCIKGFYGHLCSKSCECTANSCDPVKGCHTSGLLNSKSSTFKVKNLSYADNGLKTKSGKWICFVLTACTQGLLNTSFHIWYQVEVPHVPIFNLDRRINVLYIHFDRFYLIFSFRSYGGHSKQKQWLAILPRSFLRLTHSCPYCWNYALL